MGITKNWTGQKFGKLTFIRATEQRNNHGVVWELDCECGKIAYILGSRVASGHTKSCGCIDPNMNRRKIVGQITKTCSACKIEKSFDMFNKNQYKCKKCVKIYYQENIDNIKKYHKIHGKKYRQENKEKMIEYAKEWWQGNKEHKSEYDKQYKIKNRIKLNLKQVQRRKNDLSFKLRGNISSLIRYLLKKNGYTKKGESCLKYLSWTLDELKQHLEKQFEPWMTWDNKGKYDPKTWDDNDPKTWTWQLDHIIPHSIFNYTSMDSQEFRDCWALSNLRPLSAKQNWLDGASKVRH